MSEEERRQFSVRVFWWRAGALISVTGLVITLLLSMRSFATLPERVTLNEQAIRENSGKIETLSKESAAARSEDRERLARIEANTESMMDLLKAHMRE